MAKAPAKKFTLASVTRGKLRVPYKVLIYATEGVGKSTFAAGAPAPIFLPVDNRTAHLDIARLPRPTTWDDALDSIRALEDAEFAEFQTLVIDPINWLEELVTIKVVGSNGGTLEAHDGGYGRGHAAALEHWRIFRQQLDRLWESGKNIVLVAHARAKTFNDPLGPAYDRYELAMNEKAAGLFRQWCDFVLFAQHEDLARLDQKTKIFRGESTGARLLRTEHCAAYDAKFTGRSPGDLPLSWSAFAGAADKAQREVDDLRTAIRDLAEGTLDPVLMRRAEELVGTAGANVEKLAEVLNALRVKIETSKTTTTTNETTTQGTQGE
jgi:hypothetical protein